MQQRPLAVVVAAIYAMALVLGATAPVWRSVGAVVLLGLGMWLGTWSVACAVRRHGVPRTVGVPAPDARAAPATASGV